MSGNSNQQLRKTIGFNAALSTVVGILIGSGVFSNHKLYIVQLMEGQV